MLNPWLRIYFWVFVYVEGEIPMNHHLSLILCFLICHLENHNLPEIALAKSKIQAALSFFLPFFASHVLSKLMTGYTYMRNLAKSGSFVWEKKTDKQTHTETYLTI